MNGSLYIEFLPLSCMCGMLLMVSRQFLPAEHLGIDISITANIYDGFSTECYTNYSEDLPPRLWKR